MADRQFATPLIIQRGGCTELSRLQFSDERYDEDWLQDLLFEHPRLIPFGEIDSLFADSIPVVRELPIGARSIDLFYVNSRGLLTIVETKLWRNPEAMTNVVAQIINYASVLARWKYEDLVKGVGEAAGLKSGNDPFLDLAKRKYRGRIDQAEFVSEVKKSLRLGRFLLLIVGDSIREELEDLTEFLQRTPQLGFRLALVEIALFHEHSKGKGVLFVQPRVVARTREVTRAVVEIKVPIDSSQVDVTVKEDETPVGRRPGPMPIEVFLVKLEKETNKQTRQLAEWVLNKAPHHQLMVHLGEAGPNLKYVHKATGTEFNFGQLHYKGVLSSTWSLYYRFQDDKKLRAHSDICRDYFDAVVRGIRGASRKRFGGPKEPWEVIVYNGENAKSDDDLPLAKLIPKKERWLAAIDKAVRRIHGVLED